MIECILLLASVYTPVGEIGEASGTQIEAVTHWNYKTISRGKQSLIGRLAARNGKQLNFWNWPVHVSVIITTSYHAHTPYPTWCSLLHKYTLPSTVPEDLVHNYISVFGLRTYGELNGRPVMHRRLMTPYQIIPIILICCLLSADIGDCIRTQQVHDSRWQSGHHWIM